ncbi:hypothetical protein M413DRAFT_447730 [Hebeloma cylindrosporum]|uniref:Uncharacterized protein n=1 Tax=Hebeloma cylindrosporum TaxID=76867 RepID=A0A0C2YBX6_HEBCY|nr:hypothetical protein M413DRAFT_447730 [Hebeloma cylindrosporum h7]
MSQLQDDSNVWLITGASSGFGKRFILSVLARGDRVIATARSLDKLDEMTSSLKPELAQRLRVSQLDVTEGEEKIHAKIALMAKFWGRIDILVNNAGFGLPALVEEGGTRLLRRQFDTNVFGVLDVATATIPFIRESKSGCVVTIGSRSAWKPEIPLIGPYAASKAAVHALTETLTLELAQFNIKVLLVEPGAFRTEGIYGQPYFTENPIPAYDRMRNASKTRFGAVAGTEKGDPDKAVEVIVDVVRGEGVAKGRPWPGYLVLGEDAEVDVRNKCKKVLDVLDEWVDVARGVNFDTPQA